MTRTTGPGQGQPDRRIHADALRRQHRQSQLSRFKRHVAIMLTSVALSAVAVPYAMLDEPQRWATGVYAYARGTLWIAAGVSKNPTIRFTYKGTPYRMPARAVIAEPYHRRAAGRALDLSGKGGALGFAGWLSCQFLFRGIAAQRRERALRDRVVAGTRVTTERRLARLTGPDTASGALAIGTCRSRSAWRLVIWQ